MQPKGEAAREAKPNMRTRSRYTGVHALRYSPRSGSPVPSGSGRIPTKYLTRLPARASSQSGQSLAPA